MQSSQVTVRLCRRRARRNQFVFYSPATVRLVQHGPYPQKRPQDMQREQAHPPGCMDRVLMWMVASLGDPMRDVVNSDDAVEHDDDDKEQHEKCEVVQERIVHRRTGRMRPSFYSRVGIARAGSL
jgi:hypothetical protein